MTYLVELWCIACGQQRTFEPLDCADGHEVDCPERACTTCGSAVLIAPWPDIDQRHPAVVVRAAA